MTSSFKSAIEQAIENFEAAAHAAEALETASVSSLPPAASAAESVPDPEADAEVVPGGHAVKMKGFLGPILTR